jgi:hypothetical protein
MDSLLVVVRPFGRYVTGEEIKDAADLAAVLAGDHAGDVVRVRVPMTPALVAADTPPQALPHRREV